MRLLIRKWLPKNKVLNSYSANAFSLIAHNFRAEQNVHCTYKHSNIIDVQRTWINVDVQCSSWFLYTVVNHHWMMQQIVYFKSIPEAAIIQHRILFPLEAIRTTEYRYYEVKCSFTLHYYSVKHLVALSKFRLSRSF